VDENRYIYDYYIPEFVLDTKVWVELNEEYWKKDVFS
jgi:hypothetical protein